MSTEILTTLISSLFSAVIGVVVGYLLTQKKNIAEIEKLKAEAEKARAETEKIRLEIEAIGLQNISNTVSLDDMIQDQYKDITGIWEQTLVEQVSITWGQIIQILRRLGVKIRSGRFVPDVVVGVAREGSIVASIFAYSEGYKPFCVLERKELEPVQLIDTVPTNIIEGKKVLLIDSECNREDGTLKEARDFLLSKKFAAEVRTMVLGKSVRVTHFKIDYFAFEYLERPEWPWLYTEEVKERDKGHEKLIKSQQ